MSFNHSLTHYHFLVCYIKIDCLMCIPSVTHSVTGLNLVIFLQKKCHHLKSHCSLLWQNFSLSVCLLFFFLFIVCPIVNLSFWLFVCLLDCIFSFLSITCSYGKVVLFSYPNRSPCLLNCAYASVTLYPILIYNF